MYICILNRETPAPEEQRDARCGIKFIEHLLRIRISYNEWIIIPVFLSSSLFFQRSAEGGLLNHVTNNKYNDI